MDLGSAGGGSDLSPPHLLFEKDHGYAGLTIGMRVVFPLTPRFYTLTSGAIHLDGSLDRS